MIKYFNLPFNHLTQDEEFYNTLSEFVNNITLAPLHELTKSSKLFSPFEFNENFNSPLEDIDPDVQFYNSQSNTALHHCDYFLSDDFNTKLKRLKLSKNAFSMIH